MKIQRPKPTIHNYRTFAIWPLWDRKQSLRDNLLYLYGADYFLWHIPLVKVAVVLELARWAT